MGLKCAPDFAQQVMDKVLCNVDNKGVYHDDISGFSMTWENHILQLDKIFNILLP